MATFPSPSSLPTIFSLEGKSLKLDTAEDLKPHIQVLIQSPNITEIRLGGNTFGVPACAYLAPVLSSKHTLHTANLADIFTSRLLDEIPQALSSLLTALLGLPNLHTIDLSDNAFGLNTQAPLVDFLSRHTPLKHLILNNNGLGPRAGTLIADALTTLAARKAKARKSAGGQEDVVGDLETVVCGRNRLENASMAAWAKAFEAHKKGIRTVKMTQNGIRQEGISHLLREGLRHATGLEVLDVQDNTFTILGAGTLTQILPGWSRLRELGVGDCLLSARGGVRVAETLALGKNQEVEVLRLGYNDIDAAGVKKFVHAARNALPKLRRVELNGNKFNEDDESVDALRELLDERREQHGKDDDPEEHWGLDELDELEEESDEDEEDYEYAAHEEAEGELEEEEKAEKVLKEADDAEEENVPQEKDEDVDKLAEKLGKTEI